MRLLAAMQRAGFVAATPVERGYVPGPQAGALALATLRASAYTRACRAVLAQLAGTLGETCNLTAPDGDRVIYMERVETAEPLRLIFAVGSHVPMHCTASGKLFLASMSRLERARVVARLPLTRNTPRTLTRPSSWRKSWSACRARHRHRQRGVRARHERGGGTGARRGRPRGGGRGLPCADGAGDAG